jgi:hypothetical protein
MQNFAYIARIVCKGLRHCKSGQPLPGFAWPGTAALGELLC